MLRHLAHLLGPLAGCRKVHWAVAVAFHRGVMGNRAGGAGAVGEVP